MSKTEKHKQADRGSHRNDSSKNNRKSLSPNTRANGRRVSSGIMDMNVVDDERRDPSLRISQPAYTNFDIGDYLTYN